MPAPGRPCQPQRDSRPGRGADPDPPRPKLSPEERGKAEKAVNAYLEKVKGGHAAVTPLEDEAIQKVFPGQAYFGVLFRQYPVGSKKGLAAHFRTHLPRTASDDFLKEVVRSWLKLSQELHQDGFCKQAPSRLPAFPRVDNQDR